jgi:hypothetical protein
MLPAWADYVMGLEEGFERSRQACERILLDDARDVEPDGVVDAAGDRPGSRFHIIPAAEASRDSDRETPSGAADPDRPPNDADESGPEPEWTAPLAWAASGFTMVAGWAWTRRRLRKGWAFRSSDREEDRESRKPEGR